MNRAFSLLTPKRKVITGQMHIFWDNSNIYIGAKNAAKTLNPADPPTRVRVYFKNLMALVARGRAISQTFVAGSVPPPGDEVWQYLRDRGVADPVLYDRVANFDGTTREQGVDERIHLAMANTILDDEPDTMAVLTGDGAEYEAGVSFPAAITRALKAGWKVELYGWNASMSTRLRDTVIKGGGKHVPLDNYYSSVTFVPQSDFDTYSRIVRQLPTPLTV